MLDNGHAYQSGGGVYFDINSFDGFGSLSGYDRDEMLRLAAIHGGNPDDPNKRDPLDFVLWQPSAPDEPAWHSLWGPGRPGWHIECSALAMRELESPTIDLVLALVQQLGRSQGLYPTFPEDEAPAPA